MVLLLQHWSQWRHDDTSTGFPCLFTSEWAHLSFYTRCWSPTLSLPFKNAECQQKHVAHDTQSSLKASRSIVNVSVGNFFKRTQNWIVYRCLVFNSTMRWLLNTLYIYEHRCSLLTPIEVKFLLKADETSGYTCICMVTTFKFFNFLTCDSLIIFWTTLVSPIEYVGARVRT